ncbi:hypothetical protein CRI94_15535 [Longibacter salinarum]|uniref:Uncharacterized protein n=1 Tax=Longibacter salinarum TaxID=1850348 RepID=A0A2A8CUL3_9BACT|nr:hypothetical protein [Longibacter salinarum]PEN11446.1 hypothetical protein CRI94_15535 [Longibacter salinarum]
MTEAVQTYHEEHVFSRVLLRASTVLLLFGPLLVGANVPCYGQAVQKQSAVSASNGSSQATAGSVHGSARTSSNGAVLVDVADPVLPCVAVPAPRWMDYAVTLTATQRTHGIFADDHSGGSSPGGSSSGGGPPPAIVVPPPSDLLLPDGDRGSVLFLSSAQMSLSTQRTVVLRL